MRTLLLVWTCVAAIALNKPVVAQPCLDPTILSWQQHYKYELLKDPRSPLTAADTGNLRFYAPLCGNTGHFHTKLRRTPDAKPIQMATHSGKVKTFRPYGKLQIWEYIGVIDLRPRFLVTGKSTLTLYESVDRPDDTTLFLPFYDETNGTETYAGGRYIDIPRSTFDKKGWGDLDFGKAYNPWCAYKEGYNCPIPPKENRIKRRIEAGEKLYAGPHKK